jgi:hypothetical protein
LGRSLPEPFGQFDDRAPLGWAFDFPERNDEPETLTGTWIDVVILQRLRQFFIEIGGMVGAHNENSRGETHMMTRADELSEMAATIVSTIEKARYLKLPTSAYILSMALLEVMEERDAIPPRRKDDKTR